MQRRSDWFVGAVADVARLRELPVLLNSGEPSYVAGVCSPWLGRLLVGDVVVAAVIFLVRWLTFHRVDRPEALSPHLPNANLITINAGTRINYPQLVLFPILTNAEEDYG